MLEDSYLCECNITLAEKLKEQVWSTIFVGIESRARVTAGSMKIAYYNDIILHN